MKNLIKPLLITLILLTQTVKAQTTLEQLQPFIAFGIDPKMAIAGPGHDWGNKPTLDYEIRAGVFVSRDKIRISHAFKSHKHIGFKKYTYLQVDKYFNLTQQFRLYAGLEISAITRESFTYHYSKPDDYRQFKTNWLRRGANVEINYKPKNSFVSASIRASMYQAETDLLKYKKYRKEVTISIFIHSYY